METEGTRAELLSGTGVAVGPQLPAWSSAGDRRTQQEPTPGTSAGGNGGGTYPAPIRSSTYPEHLSG